MHVFLVFSINFTAQLVYSAIAGFQSRVTFSACCSTQMETAVIDQVYYLL